MSASSTEPGSREFRDESTGLRLPLKFPVELRPPPGFKPDEPQTWPQLEGRLEFVQGRLVYMPPCADNQQQTVPDVLFLLRRWSADEPGFIVGGNEAGMSLEGETRGADAAVWRASDWPKNRGVFVSKPPILAVEVEGEGERESALRSKAAWYFDHGVRIVWLVLHSTREVVVLTPSGESRHRKGESLAQTSELPGLAPAVDDFFIQIDRTSSARE